MEWHTQSGGRASRPTLAETMFVDRQRAIVVHVLTDLGRGNPQPSKASTSTFMTSDRVRSIRPLSTLGDIGDAFTEAGVRCDGAGLPGGGGDGRHAPATWLFP
jgi:hypothetical protein